MALFKIILTLLFMLNSGLMVAHAESEDSEVGSEVNTTESIVGDHDVREENHSNYEVPTSADLEGVTQMEVVNNVNERGDVFNHENLVGTKQFLTVVTPDGRTYYIIINYEEFGTKVHLLKDMSEIDVESVASAQPQAGAMTPAQAELYMEQNANGEVNNAEVISEEESSPMKTNLIILGVVVVGVAIFGFFKLKKDKTGGSSDNFE